MHPRPFVCVAIGPFLRDYYASTRMSVRGPRVFVTQCQN